MNTENITRVRRLDLNTVLYSGSAYQSQGSSAAGHWINNDMDIPNSLLNIGLLCKYLIVYNCSTDDQPESKS